MTGLLIWKECSTLGVRVTTAGATKGAGSGAGAARDGGGGKAGLHRP